MFRKPRSETMAGIIVTVFVVSAFFHPGLVFAQASADLVALWLVTVEGDARAGILRVQGAEERPDGSVALKGRYGFADGNLGAVSAEITQAPEGRKLSLTTNADSVIVAVQAADGAFSGTITYKSGVVKPVQLAKTSAAELATLAKASPTEGSAARGPGAAKGAGAASSGITLVYWSSDDCPYCRSWEGSLGGYGKFREMPEYSKIKFYTVRNDSLKSGYDERHFPPELGWLWARYQQSQRHPGRPGWQVYVGRKLVASFQGATQWEANHLPRIKDIIAQNSAQ